MGHKKCGCCQQIKSINDFYVYKLKDRPKKKIHTYCKKCQNILMRERFRDFKQKCLEYKGNMCERCGYDDYEGALDFHHKDPNQKELTFSKVKNRSFDDKIKAELDKCMLLCANCHREAHYEILLEQEKDSIEHQMFLKFGNQIEKPEIKPYLDFKCQICERVFKSKNCNAKYCSIECSNSLEARKDTRKVSWPTKDELKHLIETQSWVSIGKQYGVSDNAVRKWAKRYKLI